MRQLKFKTNINCSSCVRAISGYLNEVEALDSWNVDTANTAKILTVQGEEITAKLVVDTVEEAGFDIELI